MPNKAWPGCNVNDPSARVLELFVGVQAVGVLLDVVHQDVYKRQKIRLNMPFFRK